MKEPTIEVLISCMYQTDTSIIEKSNIQTDAIVINQCDRNSINEFTFKNKRGELCNVRFISTTERGLSKSRNMAIRNSSADICLICDDDEFLRDDYADIIKSAYLQNSKFDFIIFNMEDRFRTFPTKKYKINFIKALKVASWQISFKRESIIKRGICIDETMGAGITMGGGEENKFIVDCLKNKLLGVYIPDIIGKVSQESSTWDLNNENCKQYFQDRGGAYKKIMGCFCGSAYILYSSLKKYRYYRAFLPLNKCIYLQFKGLINS